MPENTTRRRTSINWGFIVVPVVALLAILWFVWGQLQPRAVDTSEGLQVLSSGTVTRVDINERTQQINLTLSQPWTHQSTGDNDQTRELGTEIYFTYSSTQSSDILSTVTNLAPARGWNAQYPTTSLLASMMQTVIPLLLFIGVFYFLMRSAMGRGGMMGGMVQSRVKEFNQENPEITFADVAGEDEAVEELEEIREFLASPDKFPCQWMTLSS